MKGMDIAALAVLMSISGRGGQPSSLVPLEPASVRMELDERLRSIGDATGPRRAILLAGLTSSIKKEELKCETPI